MPLRLKLEDSDEQILAGKKALADALIQVGITAVEPNPNRPDSYETFQSYADKIKRLMISNSFILEYQIPEEGFEKLTKYKRTVFLPVSGASINRVTKSIIDSDTGYTPSNSILSSTLVTNNKTNYGLEHATVDIFGNIVSDGSIEIEESEESKNYSAGQEFAERHANEPMTLALEDDYSFSVDWGDGSPICEFVDFDSTPEAWYHTYEKPGTYDVTINGIFRVPYSWPDWNGPLNLDGEFVYDRDGSIVRESCNYSTQYYLIKVIACGNTRFRSLVCTLANTRVLQSIPIIDTTKSFEDVVSCESFCYIGRALSTLPYDSNTERGMFTNMPIVSSMTRCFQSCAFTSEIPDKITELSLLGLHN